MELVFEEQSMNYLRCIFSKAAAQEQTQELIVPDSYPDCGRIVFTGASALMRGKECREGSAIVTGGVRAGILYVPEDGSEARALECYLPYSIRIDDPAATEQMQLQACCQVRAADARLINSRKILVRTNVVCQFTAFAQATQSVGKLQNAPSSLQTKTEAYRCVLPREYAEKAFSMTEDMELSSTESQMEKIVQYWLTPEIQEQKLTGNKAVIKGNLVFKALVLGTDGVPQTYQRQIPLSQYCELDETYDDDEMLGCLCVTGSEAELVLSQQEPAKILLSASLLFQCISMQTHELCVTKDAYATRGTFSPVWSDVALPCLLDRQMLPATLRGSVPKQARAVIDSTLYLDVPISQKKDGEIILNAPATVNILYMDTDGMLQSAIVRDQVSCTLPADGTVSCQASVSPVRDGFAAPSGSAMDVRYDVNFCAECYCDQALRILSGGTLEESGKTAEHFCVVVRRAEKTQSLWELGKQYRTSEQAIAAANGITTGEAEQGALLLIPV